MENADPRVPLAFATLREFVSQRPGFESANYSNRADYHRDYRPVQKDLARALTLLDMLQAPGHEFITFQDIQEATRAFSGRLHVDNNGAMVEYTAGQYWPTEYRRAVVVVLEKLIGIK